jgi:hypothetical protein
VERQPSRLLDSQGQALVCCVQTSGFHLASFGVLAEHPGMPDHFNIVPIPGGDFRAERVVVGDQAMSYESATFHTARAAEASPKSLANSRLSKMRPSSFGACVNSMPDRPTAIRRRVLRLAVAGARSVHGLLSDPRLGLRLVRKPR